MTSPISRRRLLAGTAAAATGTLLATDPMNAHAYPPTAPAGGLAVSIGNANAGAGLAMVGYNTGHFMPGGNTHVWIDYAGVNTVRFFASFGTWCPDELFHPGTVDDVEAFDQAVAKVRAHPREGGYIDWDELVHGFTTTVYPDTNHYILGYELGRLRELGITPVLEAAELRWNTDWTGLFLQFLKHYAFSYWCAAEYGVTHYNFVNEPDHPSAAGDIVNQTVYIRGLQIASHAIKSAVDDVNALGHTHKKHQGHLVPIVQAPVITHSSQESGPFHMDADADADHRDDDYGWGQISLLNLFTDYHGDTMTRPVFDYYDTHLYNKTAETYTAEITMVKAKMRQYTPDASVLPVVYSEFNRRNTSAFETSTDTLDTPVVMSQLAEIWPAAMTAGAHGMLCFKFDNTVRSNGIPYGTGNYYVSATAPYPIRGVSKAAEANRMFATRFTAAPGRRLVTTTVSTDGPTVRDGVRVCVYDQHADTFTVWLPHDAASSYPVELDLRRWPRLAGRSVVVEEVSATMAGGVTALTTVPPSGQLQLTQPGESVWRLTVQPPGRPHQIGCSTAISVTPTSHSTDELLVRRDPAGGAPAVSYLTFERHGRSHSSSALLELTGASADGKPLSFRVYGLLDPAGISRSTTWATAPHLDTDLVRARDTDPGVLPLGMITVFGDTTPRGDQAHARLDVSRLLQRGPGTRVGMLLVREQGKDDDTADDGRTAKIDRKGHTGPRLLVWD